MYKVNYVNKNTLLAVLMLSIFIVSIGAMLPVVANSTNSTTNGGFVDGSSASTKVNQPSTGTQPATPVITNPTPNTGSSSATASYQPAKAASTAAVSSTTSVTMPAYNTTTVYENSSNFNVATPNLLPFAEKYRINSTLNGWVYPNGLSPDYVPLNKLFYNHTNLAPGATINSTSATDFPVSALRFIPGYPATIVLKANSTQVGLAVYNTSNYIVASSTNTAYMKSVTFTPTSEQIYSALVTELTGTNPASFNLTIQQFVTPKFFNLFVGDQGSATGTFSWFFNSSITSFGLYTPPTLDLDTLTYNRTDTATVDYTYNAFTGYGYNTVIDNASYWSTQVPSYFYFNSTSSCNDALTPVTRCQSFLPMFFYDSANPFALNTGLWVPSLEVNHTFGANPQVLNLMGYFGQTGIQGVTKAIVLNSNGTTVLDLSNQFTKSNATSFLEKLSILLPTTTLMNGSYTLKIYNGALELYSYPFKVQDSLYGNYYSPVVKFGYETTRFLSNQNTETNGTIVYASVTDKDTSVTKVMLSYYQSGIGWSTPTSMTWLDVNQYGFVIPLNLSNVLNVSISVFESAPSDQGQMRLQVLSQFNPGLIDLSYNTSTTMQVTFIPRGGSTTGSTQIKFLNDNSYQLVGLSGAQVTNSGGYYVYTIANPVTQNQESNAYFTITPKNSGLLTVNTTVVTTVGTTLQESQLVYLNVAGLTTPTLQMSFVTQSNGKLKNLYPYLNSTYPVTVKYRFIGGTPSANFNLAVSGSSGSLTTINLPINTQGVYPLTYYQAVVSPSVVKTFTGSTTTITANMTYGSTSVPITSTINSYKPAVEGSYYDLSGNLITDIYTKTMNEFNFIYQIRFYNGTPQTSLSVDLSSYYNDFAPKTVNIDISTIKGNNINISVVLTKNAITHSIDFLKSVIHWDGNSNSFQQSVNTNTANDLSTLISISKVSNEILKVNSSNYALNLNLQSNFVYTLRNVNISIENSYDIVTNPSYHILPEINRGQNYNTSFALSYSFNSKINVSQLTFKLNIKIPGLNPYSLNIVINTDSSNSSGTNSSSSTTTSSTPRSTPGFEIILLLTTLTAASLIKRKIKKSG